MYGYYEKEITKEDYEAIKAGKKHESDFFTQAQIWGYGASPHQAVERDGKYIIPFNMSDSCD